MSTNSNDQGRAYEFAWINALYSELAKTTDVLIEKNSSYEANQSAWNRISAEYREMYKVSAEAAVKAVIELEPNISEPNKIVSLAFQKDGEGIKGDVRDIVITRDDIEWEIGLSIKHNHEAVKHSRLSHQLDFGKEWFNIPCSKKYWDDVKPIFDFLKTEKEKGSVWNEMAEKEQRVYLPLLNAFMDEIKKSYNVDSELPRKMVEYLIGIKDYYKAVSRDSKRLTLIETFNMHDTLNKPCKTRISAITVPVIELPTKIVALDYKENSSTTVEMYLNNGWELSFRIHNASTRVEPSLKFDIQFMGMPPTILTISCNWK